MTPRTRLIAFCCRWCSYAGADAAGRARLPVPASARVVRVPCAGRVDAGLILDAFAKGADGVLVLGCGAEDCHYRKGSATAARRVALVRKMLPGFGIEPERLAFDSVSASEGSKFAEVVKAAADRIERLGGLALKREAAEEGAP